MITTARHPAFVAHAPEFEDITGDSPRLSMLAEVDAHEGPVYFADEDALYFTTLPRQATAFSPTDTLPLSAIAKLLMAVPSLTALVTVLVVVARAVTRLG